MTLCSGTCEVRDTKQLVPTQLPTEHCTGPGVLPPDPDHGQPHLLPPRATIHTQALTLPGSNMFHLSYKDVMSKLGYKMKKK